MSSFSAPLTIFSPIQVSFGWRGGSRIMDSAVRFCSEHVSFRSIILLLIAYHFTKIIYNVYFHPLARHPGPGLRAISSVPKFYSRASGKEVTALASLHQKYGKVVRVAPNELSFVGTAAWKDIYSSTNGRQRTYKPWDFYNPDNQHTPSLLFADDHSHSRIRRIIAHAFTPQALREQEPILNKYFDLFISRLRDHATSHTPTDIMSFYNFTTFDILGDLCFGESFGALATAAYHPWMNTIFDNIRAFTVLQLAKTWLVFDLLFRVLLEHVPAIAAARKKHMDFTRIKTERRMAAMTSRKDFMSYILRHKDDGTATATQRALGHLAGGITHEEIWRSMDTLITAGSETTATLLSGATYLLLKHPAELRRLQNEIRNAFPIAENITVAAVLQLPYLRAVIDESLRIYPPVPIALPRMAREDMVIDGLVVPAGTKVGVTQWVASHSPANFKNPEEFVPERWIEGERCEYECDARDVVQPFSVGPRGCVGKSLAYAEMTSLLARVVYHFDLALCGESENWLEQRVFTLWEKSPLMVTLTEAER